MWAAVLAVILAGDLPVPASELPAEDPAAVGLVAGAATAIVPLVVGGALMSSDGSPRLEAAGIYVMTSGFALAPWVAHGAEGSWRRATFYGGISLAMSAGTVVAMDESNAFGPRVGNRARIPMKILLPCAMGSAAFGVFMSAFDHGDAPQPPSRLSVWIVPAASGLATGLTWGASL